MKNPEKWKRYSLEDVEDVTQKSNSAAAFAFLDDLKKRKEREEEKEEEEEKMELDGGCAKIVFKAPTTSRGKRDKKSVRKVIVREEEEEGEKVEEEKEEEEERAACKSDDKPISESGNDGVDLANAECSSNIGSSSSSSSSSAAVSGSLGSKFVMKEYVVGASKGKTREKKEKPKIGKEIKLSHLDDGEDEEKDDED